MNTRQIRVIGLCAILVLLILYYISNGARNTRDSAFYRNTVSVLTIKKGGQSTGEDGKSTKIDLDSPEEKLKIENYKKAMRELALQFDPAGEDKARADVQQQLLAQQKTEQPLMPTEGLPQPSVETPLPDAIQANILPPANDADAPAIDAEKSVAGRKTMKDKKPGADGDDGVAKIGNVGSPSRGKSEGQSPETDQEHKIEAELNDILKRGPIVVFSKSYCPFSRKAKHILQDLYAIVPAPHVVELDLHELGPGLQSSLASMTGRRTVPNVLINGKSIGGGDDIEALHQSGSLIETIQSLAGKRVTSISAKPPAEGGAERQPRRMEVKLKV